ILFVVLLHRKQLYSGNAKRLEVRDFFDETRIGASFCRSNARGRVLCETLDVQLVDEGFRKRGVQRPVALPVVLTGIDHHASHGVRAVVPATDGGLAIEVSREGDSPSVRIQEDLPAVETVAF